MGMMPPNNMMGPGGPMMGPPGMMRPPGMGGPPGMNMNGPPGPMNMGGPPGPMNMGGPPGPMNMMGGPPGPMNMMGPPNMMGPGGPMMGPPGMGPGSMGGPGMGMPDFPDRPPERPKKKKPTVVLSATPKLYINKEDKKENTLAVPSGPELPPPMEKNQKPMSKKKAKEMADAVAASIVTQTVVQSGPSNPGQSNSQQNPGGQNLKKKDKNNKAKKIRTAGGVAWEDPTLAEWEDGEIKILIESLIILIEPIDKQMILNRYSLWKSHRLATYLHKYILLGYLPGIESALIILQQSSCYMSYLWLVPRSTNNSALLFLTFYSTFRQY
ncbi:pre-mRNA 3' end processing protein WDR33-like [Diaphorina citri]|uniref:Pre-mRNA 3' end processing protein WDR33-like n=1 Tax=Diaphorina citri TaxID=121845 RepID=A0A1S3D5M1_DIACI|nr:pre-mRNA 3' end processing protein WDR33-like [Diaphorina citri]